MESVLGRLLVMVIVGVLGGCAAILLVRTESKQKELLQSYEAKREVEEVGKEEIEQVFKEHPHDDDDDDEENDYQYNQIQYQNDGASNDIRSSSGENTGRLKSDAMDWRQKLPPDAAESSPMMTSQLPTVSEREGSFLDELFLTLKRKLLSYSTEKWLIREKRGVAKSKHNRNGSRRVKRDDDSQWTERDSDALGNDSQWKEIPSSDVDITDEDKSPVETIWEKIPDGHRIRHSGRKSRHRHFGKTSSRNSNDKTESPFVFEMEKSVPVVEPQSQHQKPLSVVNNPEVSQAINEIQQMFHNRTNNYFDNFTNIKIMGNITHIKTPQDIMHDESNIANEIREALLLAIPLSLLMTVLILIFITFCCCRYRQQAAYSDRLSYPLIEEEYSQDCPCLSVGVCEACLPDIKYPEQMKNRGSIGPPCDQMELVLEGDTMEDEVESPEVLKGHPPLYALLSNLPPGGSHLEKDNRKRDGPYKTFTSSSSSFSASRPKRSQSLEFLIL